MKKLLVIAALFFALSACSNSSPATAERSSTSEATEPLGVTPEELAFADGAEIAAQVAVALAGDGLAGSNEGAECAADRMITELGSSAFAEVVAVGSTADLTLSAEQSSVAVAALFDCGDVVPGLAAGIQAGGVDAAVASCIASGVDLEVYRSSMTSAFSGPTADDLSEFARELKAAAALC